MIIFHIDIETTGKDHLRHGIHEIGGFVEIDGQTVFSFEHFVRPTKAGIDIEAMRVTGKTLQDIRKYPASDKIFKTFVDLIYQYRYPGQKDKIFISAFNAPGMEMLFLREWFKDHMNGYFREFFHSLSLDTMMLAGKYLLDRGIILNSYSLESVAEKLGIEIDPTQLHKAKYDASISQQIYNIVK